MNERKAEPRVALVTGANRGLGLETSRQLATLGHHVVVAARDAERGREAAAVLERAGGSVSSVTMDVTDDASVRAAADHVLEEHGAVQILVNNAGVTLDRYETPITELSIEELRRTFEVNVYGALRVAQAFAPAMQKSAWGRIVQVSSGMGQLADMQRGVAAYRMSKTALNALTRILHAELHADGIKVNSVCPGWVRTRLGGANATRSVEEGAKGIVWAATLEDDGPSGGFFRDGERIEW